MTFGEFMNHLTRFCWQGLLPLMLCQCQMVEACLGFFEKHSSKGHNSKLSGTALSQPITLEQFIASQARRGLSADVLKTRFRVADANNDGLLTPEEVEMHRTAAAQNKKRSRA